MNCLYLFLIIANVVTCVRQHLFYFYIWHLWKTPHWCEIRQSKQSKDVISLLKEHWEHISLLYNQLSVKSNTETCKHTQYWTPFTFNSIIFGGFIVSSVFFLHLMFVLAHVSCGCSSVAL